MGNTEEKNKYARMAAAAGAFAAAGGALSFALNGQFDAAANATQASIGLFGLSGLFSVLSKDEETPQAILVPVPVTAARAPRNGY